MNLIYQIPNMLLRWCQKLADDFIDLSKILNCEMHKMIRKWLLSVYLPQLSNFFQFCMKTYRWIQDWWSCIDNSFRCCMALFLTYKRASCSISGGKENAGHSGSCSTREGFASYYCVHCCISSLYFTIQKVFKENQFHIT